MSKTRILLLTNRDSDNVGDQLIEESVISIVQAIMKNLDFTDNDFVISSRAAGIVSKKYLKSKNPAHLKTVRKAIASSDLVLFGGAPLFNYSYHSFYLRTIKTLEIAQELDVPVIFSSIGVEKFDSTNAKSLALMQALRFDCIRQITTRDDLDSLGKYVGETGIPVAKVSDPVVLADSIFGSYPKPVNSKKRVGLVVTRAGIFQANEIAFSEEEQRQFWLDTIEVLEERGYDYKLFTTGHFSDELFLDSFIRNTGIPESKAKVNVNSPEELLSEISGCDGVIAFRLHANIASYAFDVPAIGLNWNSKVPFFYDSVGYPERALPPSSWQGSTVVDALEHAMIDVPQKEESFLMSVYNSLFEAIKDQVDPGSPVLPYTLAEFRENVPTFTETSLDAYRQKVNRKMRRAYQSYESLSDEHRSTRVELARPQIPGAGRPSIPKRAIRKLKRALTAK